MMQKKIQIILSIFLFLNSNILFAATDITVAEIINSVEYVASNPVDDLTEFSNSPLGEYIVENYAPSLIQEFRDIENQLQNYVDNGDFLFIKHDRYRYKRSCRDRKYMDLYTRIRIDQSSELLSTKIEDFRYPGSKARSYIQADLMFDGNVKFKEKYKFLGKCQTAYSVGADIDFSIDDINLFAEYEPNFDYDYNQTSRVLSITPYTETRLYGDISETGGTSGIDLSTYYGGLFGDVVGLFGILIGNVLEGIVNTKVPGMIQKLENELNEGKVKRKNYDPIRISFPSNNYLTDDQYRSLMRKEGLGGYNCGPGKDNQTLAFVGVLSNIPEIYDTYIKPEVTCRAAIPTIIVSSILL